MAAHLEGATLRSAWALRVKNAPAGHLELYLGAAGYVWNWSDKPANLVPIVGVLDDSGCGTDCPSRFYEAESAMDYVMVNAGFAFRGDCCLEAVIH